MFPRVPTMPFRAPLAVLALLFCSAALAESFEVDWPAGWEVEQMPAPQSPFEPEVSGERQRAMKLKPNGEQEVVVEITRLPLSPSVEIDLDKVLRQMRQGIQLGFAQNLLLTACQPPADTEMGDLPAREVRCDISQQGTPVLQQNLLMARNDKAVYSLSYAMPVANAAALEETLETLRKSLRLH
ncbi:hypothetical protein DN826_07485 [Stutzerimonas nosocomialis]|nr:hypothetical protein DN826_07485 [Stutzerimonas nosocomialis]